VDLNGDGIRDILSGSYSRDEQPMAGLFQVLWGQSDGTFKTAEAIKGTDDKPLLIPLGTSKDAWIDCICTRPMALDWDGDGNLDLITGNFAGTFYLFKGEGKGKFQPKGELITTDNGPLKIVGNHSDPFMIDWDHDGDLDLLSGSSEGGVQWSENVAGPAKPPKLKAFQSLIKAVVAVKYGERLSDADLKGPTHATRIWVDDVNSDGKLDILVGDSVTLVEPAKGLTDEEFKAKSAEWQKEWDAAVADMNSPAADENKANEEGKKTSEEKKAVADKQAKAQQRIQELYNQRSSFIKEDMTGFVWLYLQK
jgi:VCBS repeat protein